MMSDSNGTSENLADVVQPVPGNIIPEHVKVCLHSVYLQIGMCKNVLSAATNTDLQLLGCANMTFRQIQRP